jgi:hypothetical protein
MDTTDDQIPRISRKIEYPSESSGDIADLDTGHTDDRTDSYLHTETKQWRHRYSRSTDRIEIVYEAHDRQYSSE